VKTVQHHKLARRRHIGVSISLAAAAWLLTGILSSFHIGAQSLTAAAESDFGYGFNVAAWDTDLLRSMGFNWMKVFNPPGTRWPVNMLLRVEATAADLADPDGFSNRVGQLALQQKGYVEAYEIGNEPNLDASYGWKVAPNAADYANLLCQAYTQIKAVDPQAIVVSAGLAPTGRVPGNWNGHPGHNGAYQDEREFFKEFVAADGASCLDVVGYHPFGFSADYDAAPDVPSADATQNCTNGFCFRGVEKLYELMQALGLGNRKVWATEFGWIVQPPQACLNDVSWQGRLWQIVSEEKQAANLVGAFQYATANWPWMGAMFIFNLNFNTTANLAPCDQMNYYGIHTRPAEAALRDMPKVSAPVAGELVVSPTTLALMITADQQPYIWAAPVELTNIGLLSFNYTVTAKAGTLAPVLENSSGTLASGEQAVTLVTMLSTSRPIGTYTATLMISVTAGTNGAPLSIPVTWHVVEAIHRTHLPVIMHPD